MKIKSILASLVLISSAFAGDQYYTVQRGDTPESISYRFNLSLESLYNNNEGLRIHRYVFPGQKLFLWAVPQKAAKVVVVKDQITFGYDNGMRVKFYAVKRGDTVGGICGKFSLSKNIFYRYNPQVFANDIVVAGKRVVIGVYLKPEVQKMNVPRQLQDEQNFQPQVNPYYFDPNCRRTFFNK